MGLTMAQDWREICAARMTRTLARCPRKPKTRAYLKSLPKRERIVVSPDEFRAISRHEAKMSKALQLLRDAQRYAAWEARGKPPSPSKPRRDRLRPQARIGRNPLRSRLYAAQQGLCGICGSHMADPFGCTIDHVTPRAHGGGNAGNMLLAHGLCNNEKADRSPTASELEFLATVNARLAAQGIEAREGQDAQRLDAKHESLVAKPCAQTPSGDSDG